MKKPVRRRTKPAQLQNEDSEIRIVFNERGTSGLREHSGFVAEAYNAALQYPGAFTLYERLRRSMPEIIMVRNWMVNSARSTKPIIDLPDEPTDDDKRYQEFIEQDFENMEGGFGELASIIANHTPFMGLLYADVSPSRRELEWTPPPFTDNSGKTWKDDWRSEYDDGLIGIRRVGFRSMSSFAGWELDGRKRAIGFKQQDFPNPPITLWKDHSLHLTFGDSTNPEGLTPFEGIWRTERLKYGFEVVMGIGFEHAAGYLKVWKTQKGDISSANQAAIKAAARAILSASEGNYATFPFGYDGDVKDVGFQAAGSLLETIQYYGILALSMYMMQFIAFNTMTKAGSLASMQDATRMATDAFNSMWDGFAKQYDDQVGKRLWKWNKQYFPNVTKRPRIRFSHIYGDVLPSELASFLSTMNNVMPLGEDDYKAIRSRVGWLPANNPNPEDQVNDFGKAKPQPVNSDTFPNPDEDAPMPDDETVQNAVDTKQVIEQALRFNSRSTRLIK